MAEARSLGLPRYRTFQSQPELARRREEHVEPLAAARVQASARQLPAAVEVSFLLTPHPLPHEASASLPALVFPVLSAPVWISRSSWSCAPFLSRGTSSSPISVWALAYDAALISAKHRTRASRAASALVFSPLRLLILPLEWPWAFRLASQTLDASSLTYSLLFLPRGSEIFLVSERTCRVSRLTRIERGGFPGLHLLAREGDLRRLRQRRVQLQAKCENAPLRRRVTERAT